MIVFIPWNDAEGKPSAKGGATAMELRIGLDVHEDYPVLPILASPGGMGPTTRISHSNGELQRFLMTLSAGSPVAVEACGSGMWISGELEKAGMGPHLAHPG